MWRERCHAHYSGGFVRLTAYKMPGPEGSMPFRAALRTEPVHEENMKMSSGWPSSPLPGR